MSEPLKMKWVLPGEEAVKPESLLTLGGEIPELVARILKARGFSTEDEIRYFLNPTLEKLTHPQEIGGLTKAAERIIDAFENGQKIAVYADFDVDGCTSASILLSFLRELGHDAVLYHPDRKQEGYGIKREAVDSLIDRGVNLIIALDLGITAVEEIAHASSRGVDVVVVDHHELPEKLPDAHAIVNPHLDDYPNDAFSHLCTAGLAFYLVAGMRAALREKGAFTDERPEPDLKAFLDLAAIGTIADMASLKGDNRIIAKAGLRVLSKTQREGLKALKTVAGIKRGKVGTTAVGFEIAPRLNASGRMDRADHATRLLLTDDSKEAKKLAEMLNGLNRTRQSIEAKLVEEALEMIEEKGYADLSSIVVANEGWHPGVVGIVASRIVDVYYRPTVVISLDRGKGKGSARGIQGFDVYAALKASSEPLASYGGHRMAGGLSLEKKDIGKFRDAFEAFASNALKGQELKRTLKIDAYAEPEEITMQCVESLARMEPHGIGNPEPVVLTKAVEILQPQIVGEKHLRFKIAGPKGPIKAIAFGFAEHFSKLEGWADIAYTPQIDYWGGSKTINLKVKDISLL